jgi:DNA replication and repair protein RecF
LYLKKLTLINYRNYCHAELEFLPGINIFFGDNAQGKSNLLESIYLLGRGKSYRTVNDESLIRWGEDFFQIRAEISNYNQSLVEEVFFFPPPAPVGEGKPGTDLLPQEAAAEFPPGSIFSR